MSVFTASQVTVPLKLFPTKRAKWRCWSGVLKEKFSQPSGPRGTVGQDSSSGGLSQPSGPKWHCWSGLQCCFLKSAITKHETLGDRCLSVSFNL